MVDMAIEDGMARSYAGQINPSSRLVSCHGVEPTCLNKRQGVDQFLPGVGQ